MHDHLGVKLNPPKESLVQKLRTELFDNIFLSETIIIFFLYKESVRKVWYNKIPLPETIRFLHKVT